MLRFFILLVTTGVFWRLFFRSQVFDWVGLLVPLGRLAQAASIHSRRMWPKWVLLGLLGDFLMLLAGYLGFANGVGSWTVAVIMAGAGLAGGLEALALPSGTSKTKWLLTTWGTAGLALAAYFWAHGKGMRLDDVGRMWRQTAEWSFISLLAVGKASSLFWLTRRPNATPIAVKH